MKVGPEHASWSERPLFPLMAAPRNPAETETERDVVRSRCQAFSVLLFASSERRHLLMVVTAWKSELEGIAGRRLRKKGDQSFRIDRASWPKPYRAACRRARSRSTMPSRTITVLALRRCSSTIS